jgi:hypothetical protein
MTTMEGTTEVDVESGDELRDTFEGTWLTVTQVRDGEVSYWMWLGEPHDSDYVVGVMASDVIAAGLEDGYLEKVNIE